MEYNFEKIGNRIKTLRLEKGLTQAALGELIGNRRDKYKPLDNKTIRAYENGNNEPPLYVLTKMCEIFDCELGYLLCEPDYERGTKRNTDIGKETGLSNASIERLNYYARVAETVDEINDCKSENEEMMDNDSRRHLAFVNEFIENMDELCFKVDHYKGLCKEYDEAVPENKMILAQALFFVQDSYLDVVKEYIKKR